MNQPNRPSCGNLTPHGEHRAPGLGGVSHRCPGVPNLADPAAQQPLSGGDTVGTLRPKLAALAAVAELESAIAAAIPYELIATPAVGLGDARRARIADAVMPAVREFVAARDAQVRADERRRVAKELAGIVAGMCPDPDVAHAGSRCDFADAAAVIREYAGKGFPRHEGDAAGDSGTPEHPEPQEER